jgi:hypothetical protein
MRTALRPHAGKCLLIACCERLQNVPPTAAIRYMKTVSPEAILPGALVAMFLISLSSFRDPRAAARRGTAYAPMLQCAATVSHHDETRGPTCHVERSGCVMKTKGCWTMFDLKVERPTGSTPKHTWCNTDSIRMSLIESTMPASLARLYSRRQRTIRPRTFKELRSRCRHEPSCSFHQKWRD